MSQLLWKRCHSQESNYLNLIIKTHRENIHIRLLLGITNHKNTGEKKRNEHILKLIYLFHERGSRAGGTLNRVLTTIPPQASVNQDHRHLSTGLACTGRPGDMNTDLAMGLQPLGALSDCCTTAVPLQLAWTKVFTGSDSRFRSFSLFKKCLRLKHSPCPQYFVLNIFKKLMID